ncbi:hypothetical protein GJ744_007991 [Endocarpon pusillum]|uniref:Trichodiene oxygenase n=1 Tax=Endocarpon pusillum TaxID=364733 RepID=A0A8H7E5Y5_9EURO|nr:hypothetical protein GJ744_007991 [Endocarpon pusillum]
MALPISLFAWTLVLTWLVLKLYTLIFNLYFHPLRKYPGPLRAAATTWWRTYIEVFKKENWTDVLIRLHEQYGDVVRVEPNELHFSKPSAYHDIYNSTARWNKDNVLYECFGVEKSSFGFLKYNEAKLRRDMLQPLFSRRAILGMQSLVRQNIDHLAGALAKNNEDGVPSDLFNAFRAFTLDTITTFCFARSTNAMDAPGFNSSIIESMQAGNSSNKLFKHFPLLRKTIFSLPAWLACRVSPATAGIPIFRLALERQIKQFMTNPESLKDQPHPIIYHRLLDPAAQKGHPGLGPIDLLHEAQSLSFGGTDTVANTLMIGFFHILSQSSLYARLQEEVLTVWPYLHDPPKLETLDTLPLLTAAIKEALRISSGATSPCTRVVPATGATISGMEIPPGTVVGMSSILVHNSSEIFKSPEVYDPDRWLAGDSHMLDQWLVPFSKGPRSCLGINLAWCELYIAFATMLRRFEMRIDGTVVEDLVWRDSFTPHYYGKHLQAWCQPVTT